LRYEGENKEKRDMKMKPHRDRFIEGKNMEIEKDI